MNLRHTVSDAGVPDEGRPHHSDWPSHAGKSGIFCIGTGRQVTVAQDRGVAVEIAKRKARALTITAVATPPRQTAGEWMTARLLQQAPMSVLQMERSDLALETELGGMFKVSWTVQRDRGREKREQ